MPRDTIEKAIMKGTGELGAENYENVTYEAYAPGGVAMMIEGLTNNPSRTAPDLRSILEKAGGNLATRGAVAFQFTKQGVITIKADVVDEDKLMEIALDAGAEDVKNEVEVYEIITVPTAYLKVKEALEVAKIPVEAGEITNMPNSTVPVDAEIAQRLLKLIDTIEDHDDVQSVSHNAEIPESVMV
jgi:YebC/PmpR family DNA-binding regulatory protein